MLLKGIYSPHVLNVLIMFTLFTLQLIIFGLKRDISISPLPESTLPADWLNPEACRGAEFEQLMVQEEGLHLFAPVFFGCASHEPLKLELYRSEPPCPHREGAEYVPFKHL